MSRNIAEAAWNKVKAKDDPEFANSAPDHQQKLEAAAADAIRTGVTINEFERAVVEINKSEQADEPKTALGTSEPTALGTTNAIGEPPPKAETKTKEKEPKKEAPKADAKSDAKK